ncbi:MAG: NfeD family protein [Ectothiorhodospiraceae bacterium]|nr:NfeD family protein [Ectothiorhodospiraceae bacterium]MCH8503319.1 NfeD family protein [Ectothiorhodospiraceae bacterium]
MEISMWQVWLILGLLLFLVDIFVAGGASGVLLVLALASVGGMLAALLGLDLAWQLFAASVAGLVSIPVVILLLRRLTKGATGSSVTDSRIASQEFEVVRQRDRLGVRVLGDFFPARTVDRTPVQEGQRVRVERFEGIVAIVTVLQAPGEKVSENN